MTVIHISRDIDTLFVEDYISVEFPQALWGLRG